MSGEFPSLGFDPAPGELDVATSVSAGVGRAARALEEIAAVLSGAADGEWRGQAAIAFRDLLSDDFRPKVDAAARSFDGAHRALDDWLQTMRSSQSRARLLESDHADAVRRARAAHATYAGMPRPEPSTGQPLTPEQQQAQADLSRARTQASTTASSADAEVDGIEAAARDLLGEYEEKGREIATRLQNAMDLAPNEPGFWQGLADKVGQVLGDLGDLAAGYVDQLIILLEEWAPVLDFIGDIAGMLAAVCGIMALIPGFQFLAMPALVLNFVALGTHYLSAVGETGSFAEALTTEAVLWDAVGVVLGVGAWQFGKKLVDAARAGSSAAGGAPAVVAVPQYVGPPIEMAPNFFQLATRGSYSMGAGEAGWRLVTLKVAQGNAGVGLKQAPENAQILLDIFGGRDLSAPQPQVVR